jgi:hypothetical protein
VEASTNQVADQQMPLYNLLPKILCRVVNVQLKVCEICLLVRVGFFRVLRVWWFASAINLCVNYHRLNRILMRCLHK